MFLGDGWGRFREAPATKFTPPPTASNHGAAIDVDRDGDLDLEEGNLDAANCVWFNDGAGTFTDSGQILGTSDTTCVVLGDLDRDSDLDLVEGNYNEADRVWFIIFRRALEEADQDHANLGFMEANFIRGEERAFNDLLVIQYVPR